MKSDWEKRYKRYSMNNWLFGEPKKNVRIIYVFLLAIIVLLGVVLS